MSHLDPPSQERVQELAEIRELRLYFRAVGDTVRLQVLRRLAHGEEMSVTELARALRVSQPLLSWHLGVLRRIGLVTVRKEGRMVLYALDRDTLHSFHQRFDAWIGGSGMDIQPKKRAVQPRPPGRRQARAGDEPERGQDV
jgi:DNA-binding transcriptional ArsR family regulator